MRGARATRGVRGRCGGARAQGVQDHKDTRVHVH